MKPFNFLAVSAYVSCAALILTGCFDDKYDLSDIDTTARIDVDSLVIPVNLDQIKMSSIIDIKPGDRVQIIDGIYTVVDSGTFHSDGVEVKRIELGAPTIDTSVSTIYLEDGSGLPIPGGMYELGKYTVTSEQSPFEYLSHDFDKSIIAIDSIAGKMSIDMTVKVSGFENITKIIEFKDMVIQLPAGLHLIDSGRGIYNSANGEYSIPDTRITGSEITLRIVTDSLDFKRAGGKIIDYGNGRRDVTLKGSNYVKHGTVTLISNSQTSQTLPPSLKLTTDYTMSAMTVTAFTGTIKYDIEGVDINDVELSDVPDVLSQKGTRLMPVNPRIYLHVNNPVQQYGLHIESGLSITSYPRYSGATLTNTLPQFTIGSGNKDGQYNLCLAPVPDGGTQGYENAQKVTFADLSYVLDTDGIPSRLGIALVNPQVPVSKVSNFRLGSSFGDVEGRYKFVAPFELKEGSTIVYTDTIDGWSDEDLDRLTVTALDVELEVASDVPYMLEFTGYPIDADHKQINNVTIDGAMIDANAKNQKVKLHITGEVKMLDGIIFKAYALAQGSSKPVTPSMSITLSKIRPRVSGYYQKEL